MKNIKINHTRFSKKLVCQEKKKTYDEFHIGLKVYMSVVESEHFFDIPVRRKYEIQLTTQGKRVHLRNVQCHKRGVYTICFLNLPSGTCN